MISSTSSCGRTAIGDDCGSRVIGDSREVDVSRMHDPCEGPAVCDEPEAGDAGILPAKYCLISALIRHQILLASDLAAGVVSV